jgi:hypothetical protein
MKYKVIDNFLPQSEFDRLQNFMMSTDFDWYFNLLINHNHDEEDKTSYFTHILYHKMNSYWVPRISGFYREFKIFEEMLDIKAMIRVKANLYPNTKEKVTHAPHVDYDFKHKGCVFSINTCNGGTILNDGTVIESIANRALLFDSSKPHSSTSCTDQKARINLNINYF